MGKRILDPNLMSKLKNKSGVANVNSMISQRAAKLGISAEAALIILAKEHGIGTSAYQRSLDVSKQAEVRDALPGLFTNVLSRKRGGIKAQSRPVPPVLNKRAQLSSAIEYLIADDELRDRCKDLLLAGSKFDRPINQATLVLEDRIRTKAKPHTAMVGETLVNFAFKEDLTQTILLVAGGNADEQRGLIQILRGIVPAFRNRTHHHVLNSFTREDAIRVCGFIDVLLRVVDSSQKLR